MQQERLRSLDGLRTLSVAAVMLYHFGLPHGAGAVIGVDVFFVLSGFVITRLLLAEHDSSGAIKLRSFYLRRAQRLWPALLVVALVMGVLSGIDPSGRAHLALRNQWQGSLVAATYWMDIAVHFTDWTGIDLMVHTWTLGVEEKFYFFWPLLLIGLLRFNRCRLYLMVVALAVLPLVERLILVPSSGIHRIYPGPDTRMDQLLIGCALATACADLTPQALDRLRCWLRRLVWPVIAALLVVAVHVDVIRLAGLPYRFYYSGGFTLVALGSAAVIGTLVLCPGHPVSRLLGVTPIAWVGRELSYSLYLWHYPVAVLVRTTTLSRFQQIGVDLVLSTVAALLSWQLVEQPVQRLRSRVHARSRMAALAVVSAE